MTTYEKQAILVIIISWIIIWTLILRPMCRKTFIRAMFDKNYKPPFLLLLITIIWDIGIRAKVTLEWKLRILYFKIRAKQGSIIAQIYLASMENDWDSMPIEKIPFEREETRQFLIENFNCNRLWDVYNVHPTDLKRHPAIIRDIHRTLFKNYYIDYINMWRNYDEANKRAIEDFETGKVFY